MFIFSLLVCILLTFICLYSETTKREVIVLDKHASTIVSLWGSNVNCITPASKNKVVTFNSALKDTWKNHSIRHDGPIIEYDPEDWKGDDGLERMKTHILNVEKHSKNSNQICKYICVFI